MLLTIIPPCVFVHASFRMNKTRLRVRIRLDQHEYSQK